MEVYLLGSAIAFILTGMMVLIEKVLLLQLSRGERLNYEYSGGKFGGCTTIKDTLANAVLSWVGVVFTSLAFVMLAVSFVVLKR